MEGSKARQAAVAEGGFTALIGAAASGDERAVAMLVEQGANVNAARESGTTALYVASLSGHQEVVRYLVEHGANVNAADNN